MAGLEAGATGYTADKVGIVGSSAGGHLAAMASTIGSFKPAFSVLFYPVITAVQGKRHQGSFINLLSEQRTPEQDAAYSLESRVTADTPPAILLLSDDDKTVPPVNSTLYYNALKAHGIEASMHIYPSGGHGWGIRDSFRYKAQWQDAVLDWLRRHCRLPVISHLSLRKNAGPEREPLRPSLNFLILNFQFLIKCVVSLSPKQRHDTFLWQTTLS